MPNHVHMMIELSNKSITETRNAGIVPDIAAGGRGGPPLPAEKHPIDCRDGALSPSAKQANQTGARPSIQYIIGRMKSFTARQYRQLAGQCGRLWQRSYYEHIIRNEQEHLEIREYIQNNALKWYEDRYYSKSE